MSKVLLDTNKGAITLELDDQKAPITVANFLEYVKANHYSATIFHRVIPGFMIQGGGYDVAGREKPTRAPIKNEAANGLKNLRGTVAMARTGVVDSATAQFFINLTDNDFLDHAGPAPETFGYCVFGKVVDGLDFVDDIARVPTTQKGGHEAWPTQIVAIRSAKVL
jgi:cyclophilin family peptidyl-prolyl cis-trans isomerase